MLYGLLAAVAISFVFTVVSLINNMVSNDEYITKQDLDAALDDFRKKEDKKTDFNRNLANNPISKNDSTEVLQSGE